MKNLLFILSISFSSVSFAQEPESKKFYFGGYVSPEFTRNLNFLEVNPTLSLSGGIFASKFLSKRFELNLALSYATLSYKLDNLVFGSNISSTTGFNNNPAEFLLRNHFIDIPLRINFHVVKKSKLNFFLTLGTGASFYISSKTTYTETAPAKTTIFKNKPNKQLFGMFIIGAGIDYNITPRMKLSILPHYRRYFRGEPKTNSQITYTAVGLNCGLSFSF